MEPFPGRLIGPFLSQSPLVRYFGRAYIFWVGGILPVLLEQPFGAGNMVLGVNPKRPAPVPLELDLVVDALRVKVIAESPGADLARQVADHSHA